MFANILIQKARLPTCQQVRFVRKTFRFRTAYGKPPLVTGDDIEIAKNNEQFDGLEYERIRFAKLSESSSPLYDNDYEKFVRYVMKGGRKNLSYDLMHQTFYHIKCLQFSKLKNSKEATEENENIETNPMTIFKNALKNSEPAVITKKVKRGGATYQVPYPISSSQSDYFATKWLIGAVLERPKRRVKKFPEVMAQELIDAAHNRGKVIKKKDDMHKLADANKAYAHYRWG